MKELQGAILIIGFVLTTANLLTYTVLAPWHKTRPGRWLAGLLLALTVVLALSVFRLLFGDFPGRVEIGLVAFSFYSLGMGYLLATIISEQYHGALRRRAAKKQKKETSSNG